MVSNPAGTRFETRLVNYLLTKGFPYAERRARNGKKDRGDLSGIPGICVEAKAVKRIALAEWMDEAVTEQENAGAQLTYVIFPRKNHHIGRAYVLCELDQWIEEHR